LAIKYSPEHAADVKRECYESLSDICYKREEFSHCIEHGIEGYGVKPVKSEVRTSLYYFADASLY